MGRCCRVQVSGAFMFFNCPKPFSRLDGRAGDIYVLSLSKRLGADGFGLRKVTAHRQKTETIRQPFASSSGHLKMALVDAIFLIRTNDANQFVSLAS